MNRTDRLYAIVEELRAVSPRPRSARWLAQRFEVSTRTIERDLSSLQQTGTPIYAETGRSGGFAIDVRHTLPPLAITPSEATALAVGLHLLANTPFGAEAKKALDKIRAVLPEAKLRKAEELASRIVMLAPPAALAPIPEALRNALTDRRLLRLSYLSQKGEITERLVEPLGFLGGDQWYLLAWCRLREAVRGFRLDRIRQVEVLAEEIPQRTINLQEIDALGYQLTELNVTLNTDRTVSR